MPGIRDKGLLESALQRPRSVAAYREDVDVFDLAAAYGYSLVQNHAFFDGNKRTAYTTTRLFLELNGFTLTAPAPDRVLAFLRVATGRYGQDDLAAWLRGQARKKCDELV